MTEVDSDAGDDRPSMADVVAGKAGVVGGTRWNFVIAIAVVMNIALLAVIATVIVRNVVDASASVTAHDFVLPPSDALNVRVESAFGASGASTYALSYRTIDGVEVHLFWMEIGRNAAQDSIGTPEPLQVLGRPAGWPSEPFEVEGITKVVATCLGVGATDSPAGFVQVPGVEVMAGPPLGAVAIVGDGLATTRLGIASGDSCDLSPDVVERIASVERGLRVVGEAQWYAYVASHASREGLTEGGSLSQDSRLPSVPVPDELSARNAINIAVSGLDRHDADGSYPNLEGGLAPNDYTAMFDGMREAIHAQPGATFTVTEIGFLSEDKAVVRYVATTDLGSGPQNFALTGRVEKIDGRWVVTRLTIEDMARRASITRPPGS